MDEQTKSNLSDRNIWSRGLYMVLMAIAFGIAEALLLIVAIFQFISALFTREISTQLHEFGANLSEYAFQIARFVTFQTEEKPFPFADWPDTKPGDTPYRSGSSEDGGGPNSGHDEGHDTQTRSDASSDPELKPAL